MGTSKRQKEISRLLRKEPTLAEEVFWQNVRHRKFEGKRFLRQHPIKYKNQDGQRNAIPDFYCRSLKLVVEIDGSIHNNLKAQDKEKDFWLEKNGYNVIRFTNREVFADIVAVVSRLKALISRLEISPSLL